MYIFLSTSESNNQTKVIENPCLFLKMGEGLIPTREGGCYSIDKKGGKVRKNMQWKKGLRGKGDFMTDATEIGEG